jgi:hypothetical protein
MLRILKQMVAAWESIPEDTPVPDEINVNEMWDEAKAIIAEAENIPNIFEP